MMQVTLDASPPPPTATASKIPGLSDYQLSVEATLIGGDVLRSPEGL